MRDDRKPDPKTNRSPSKLLKVLVAAGMALGVSAARAQDKPAPTDEKAAAPTGQGDKAKDDQKAKEKKKADEKKKAEEKKAAEDAGGVKGW